MNNPHVSNAIELLIWVLTQFHDDIITCTARGRLNVLNEAKATAEAGWELAARKAVRKQLQPVALELAKARFPELKDQLLVRNAGQLLKEEWGRAKDDAFDHAPPDFLVKIDGVTYSFSDLPEKYGKPFDGAAAQAVVQAETDYNERISLAEREIATLVLEVKQRRNEERVIRAFDKAWGVSPDAEGNRVWGPDNIPPHAGVVHFWWYRAVTEKWRHSGVSMSLDRFIEMSERILMLTHNPTHESVAHARRYADGDGQQRLKVLTKDGFGFVGFMTLDCPHPRAISFMTPNSNQLKLAKRAPTKIFKKWDYHELEKKDDRMNRLGENRHVIDL